MGGAGTDGDSQRASNMPVIPLSNRRHQTSRSNSILSKPNAREERIGLSTAFTPRRETDDSDNSDQFYDAQEEPATSPYASPSKLKSFHPSQQRSSRRNIAYKRYLSSTDAAVFQPSELAF